MMGGGGWKVGVADVEERWRDKLKGIVCGHVVNLNTLFAVNAIESLEPPASVNVF
jgi:hypothetical protein